MAKTAKAKAPRATKTLKEPKEKKARGPRGPRGIAGHPPTDLIKFKKDENGVFYGKDNNPRRAGTRSHDIFSKYKDGGSIAAHLANGTHTATDIRWDFNKGHIDLVAA